ncbi:hypothetical protein E3N88_30775 [Mikania micrantha]|uniref:Ubiquitin-like protease family profile domain-containing protein n=1 Tax=Mikania micrantha TaxID=192012 RepID=A0A5N6MMJ5_9ASTR|nr:hypothetical protein E3N88_30775 [Mikania micrantha]
MSSSKREIDPNLFVSQIIVNDTSYLQQSIHVSAMEEQKTAEESLKDFEMTNEAPYNADQDNEMLEPLNTFITKTQSKKNKQKITQSVEESVNTTQVQPKKRKKKKKPKSVHFPFDEKRLIVRCAISNLKKFIESLSSSQKKAVAEMGFEEILYLQLHAIPSAFAYWLLRNYNPETDTINDGEREIQLSSSLIEEVFKFPNGGTKVLYIYQKEKNKAKWCKQPKKLQEIDFNKLQEYEERLAISGQKEVVDEEDEVEVAPVQKKARLSQTTSKQSLKLRLKLPKKNDVCTTETDKDEEMVEESENLGENLEVNEAEKLDEDVAGDGVVTVSKTDSQEVRAERIRKKLDSFDGQAKQIVLMLEEAEKDFPEGSLIVEMKKKWASLIQKYTSKQDSMASDGDVFLSTLHIKEASKESDVQKEKPSVEETGKETKFDDTIVDGTIVENTTLKNTMSKDTIQEETAEKESVQKESVEKKTQDEKTVKDTVRSEELVQDTIAKDTSVEETTVKDTVGSEKVEETMGNEEEEAEKVEEMNVEEVNVEEAEKVDDVNVEEVNVEEVEKVEEVNVEKEGEKVNVDEGEKVKAGKETANEEVAKEKDKDFDLNKIITELPILQTEVTDFQTPQKDIVCFVDPISSVKPGKNQKRPERKKNVGELLCSPYIERQVVMGQRRTTAENNIADYLFAATGESFKEIFILGDIITTPKVIMETLRPDVDVHIDVIKTWSHILNIEEKRKSRESVYRLFCTSPMIYRDTYAKGNEAVLQQFSRFFKEFLKKERLEDVKQFGLVLFPFIESAHLMIIKQSILVDPNICVVLSEVKAYLELSAHEKKGLHKTAQARIIERLNVLGLF